MSKGRAELVILGFGLAIFLAVFGGVAAAENVPEDLMRSVVDKEVQTIEFEGVEVKIVDKPLVVSRTDWGCPDGQSSPSWSPQYHTVTHIIIHHTATPNTDPDWSARVKQIWDYHANEDKGDGYPEGWGDIGYNYLIDPNGVIYEGRAGGDDVIAAHASPHNIGTMGIAFLGTFSSVEPTSAALRSAEYLLAWKCDQRDIEPLGSGTDYVGTYYNFIAGHRDVSVTECPGDKLYNLLPAIRQNVFDIIGGGSPKFNIGDRVRTTVDVGLWVRSDHYTDEENKIWLAPDESTGLITAGPESGSGHIWWKIRYDVGIEDWSAEGDASGDFLEIYAPQYPVADSFQYPLTGTWTVSQDFGDWNYDQDGYHLAEDVLDDSYTPVYASAKGKVRYTSTNIGGYGSVIIIEHRLPDNSYVCTLYGHLSRSKGLKVNVGDDVSKGQLIGYLGDSSENGGSIPHIHFGIRRGGYIYPTGSNKYCDQWLYVGYSRSCSGCTDTQYRDMWHDPTDFIGQPPAYPKPTIGASDYKTQINVGETDWVKFTVTNDGTEHTSSWGIQVKVDDGLELVQHSSYPWDQKNLCNDKAAEWYKSDRLDPGDSAYIWVGINGKSASSYEYVWYTGWMYDPDEQPEQIQYAHPYWGDPCDRGYADYGVKISQPNQPPTLSSGYVDPPNGDISTNFYYYVTYFDPDGDSPGVKQVYIDGMPYTMSWYSGLNSHITYRYGPIKLSAGNHNYYFYFDDGSGGTVRLPDPETYSGPSVSTQPECICISWQNQGCGIGSCFETQMYQTRTCTPSGCDKEEICVSDPSCTMDWKSPSSTGKNDNEWTNPANVFSSNDQYATAYGQYLKQDYYNFNLNVPTDAIINGIEVAVEGHGETGGSDQIIVQISSSNHPYGQWGTKNNGAGGWWVLGDGIDETVIGGGPTDLWGVTWQASDFSNSNFILRITTWSNRDKLYVDHIQAKAHYTEAECTSGPCCDIPQGKFKPSGSQPTGYTDYYDCDGINNPTGTNYVRYNDYYCNGNDADMYLDSWHKETCGICRYCQSGESTCKYYSSFTSCGICKHCNEAGSCSNTPLDDSGCGTIDCSNWYVQTGTESPTDTEYCYNKNDIISDRCEGFGNCKDSNTADCDSQVNNILQYPCGVCKYISSSSCTGITLGSCSNYPSGTSCGTKRECDGDGNCVEINECEGTDTSCGVYPNCENCNINDNWYDKGSGYSCCDGDKACTCQDQEYRDYYCSEISCTYTITQTIPVKSNCVSCNDNNPCTDDACALLTGGCVFVNDDNNVCGDSRDCPTDNCDSNPPYEHWLDYPDDGHDYCQSGFCTVYSCEILNSNYNETCDPDDDNDNIADETDNCPDTTEGAIVDPDGCSCAQKTCDDQNPCTDDTCNPESAECTYTIDDANTCGEPRDCPQNHCDTEEPYENWQDYPDDGHDYCQSGSCIIYSCALITSTYNETCDPDDDNDGDPDITDCGPNDPDVYNGAPERCDGLDNDCDDETDEDFTNLGNSCTAGIGACERTGEYVCTIDGLATECNSIPGDPTEELCDGLDNDCNGQTDEGFDQDDCSENCDYVWTALGGVSNCCGDDNGEGNPYETTEKSCSDLHDNDCDGYTDQEDSDCIPTDVSIISFNPSKSIVTLGSSIKINLIIDEVPDGLSGYNLTVSLSNTSIADIVSISYPSWAILHENSKLPSDSVWMKSVDLSDQITSGDTNVTLGTLIIRADKEGTSGVTISVAKMDDDNGYSISTNTVSAILNVTSVIPFPNQTNPPTDPDGDGLYEDINGNGRMDFDDVVQFFKYLEWTEANQANPLLFDFNTNGRIDFDDIRKLFNEV